MFCSFKNGIFLCWGEDFPPSVNTVYRTGRKRIYKPAVIADWQTALLCAVRDISLFTPIFGKSPIHTLFCWWNDKTDVDNRLKPAVDAMKGIVFADDKQLVSLSSVKLAGERGFLFAVSINPILGSFKALQNFGSYKELLDHINMKGDL